MDRRVTSPTWGRPKKKRGPKNIFLERVVFPVFEVYIIFFWNYCSLHSKRFQSSYCAKVRAGAKKKMEGRGGGEKRKRLPPNPTILENAS